MKLLVSCLSLSLLFITQNGLAQTPLNKPTLNTSFKVQVYIINETTDIQMVCIRNGAIPPPAGRRIVGCSQYDPQLQLLYIWVKEPKYLEDINAFNIIGHELWHGVRGSFHD